MNINITSVKGKNKPAMGLEVGWGNSQFVMIITDKGIISCGIANKEVMESFGAVVTISRGTPEKQLKTVDDLLSAKILDLTKQAKDLGINAGDTGKDALMKLTE